MIAREKYLKFFIPIVASAHRYEKFPEIRGIFKSEIVVLHDTCGCISTYLMTRTWNYFGEPMQHFKAKNSLSTKIPRKCWWKMSSEFDVILDLHLYPQMQTRHRNRNCVLYVLSYDRTKRAIIGSGFKYLYTTGQLLGCFFQYPV